MPRQKPQTVADSACPQTIRGQAYTPVKALRITKPRMALAIIVLPVLYALNIGPVFYSVQHFGVHSEIAFALYDPLLNALNKTPLGAPYERYRVWWTDLPL